MSSKLTPRTPVAETDGESFESIPWEALATLESRWSHRHVALAAIAAVILVVGLSAMRTLGGSEPMPPVTTVVEIPPATVPPTTIPPSEAPGAAVTEADLMAVDATVMERFAEGFAELAVAEYFSRDADGIWQDIEFDPGPATFVERTSALSVRPIEPGVFEVVVAASVLDAADGVTYRRRPVQAVSLVVRVSGDAISPLDLPSPVSLDFSNFTSPVVVDLDPDPAVMDAIVAALADHGTVDPSPISYGALASGSSRVVVRLTDEVGLVWPVAVTLGSDGTVSRP
jgi:hypothetical protein